VEVGTVGMAYNRLFLIKAMRYARSILVDP
jgi:hypothetical protein